MICILALPTAVEAESNVVAGNVEVVRTCIGVSNYIAELGQIPPIVGSNPIRIARRQKVAEAFQSDLGLFAMVGGARASELLSKELYGPTGLETKVTACIEDPKCSANDVTEGLIVEATQISATLLTACRNDYREVNN